MQNISQGSVATHLTCGVIFSTDFIRNLLLSLTVKYFEDQSQHDVVTEKKHLFNSERLIFGPPYVFMYSSQKSNSYTLYTRD